MSKTKPRVLSLDLDLGLLKAQKVPTRFRVKICDEVLKEMEAAAGRCKLPPNLRKELEAALGSYLSSRPQLPAAKVRKKRLEVAGSSKKLAGLLGSGSLAESLLLLRKMAEHNARRITTKKGRPSNPQLRLLLYQLREILRKAGQKRTRTKNPVTGEVSGPWLDFSAKVLEVLGHGMKKETLARILDSIPAQKRETQP